MKYLFLLVFCFPAFSEEAPYVGEVIGWKFNHAKGMSTRAGVITEFPKIVSDRDGNTRNNAALPAKAEVDQWTAEYVAWKVAQSVVKTDKEEIEALKARLSAVEAKVTSK